MRRIIYEELFYPSKGFNNIYENLGEKINDAIDNELKELEQDQANIESLLKQLDEFNLTDNNANNNKV